ncbi:MAG: glutamate 5-kinase [Peptococcaceae bacterium]|nr:glutamate 5-kinase [Peptococcaceae bacterium]
MRDRKELSVLKRIVVKIGSSSIAHKNGKPNLARLEILVKELANLRSRGVEVILVTSGAIGVGNNRLGFLKRPQTIPEKQAAAAVGQGLLMHIYEKLFSEYGVTVGQILLTKEDFSDRRRFLNARNTLYALMNLGVIPIINENDTVAIDEIRVGDNDTLAALVGGLADIDLLILLSDVDGLYSCDPRTNKDAGLISEVLEVNEEIEALAGGAGSCLGTGGMATKVQAAKIAVQSGFIMALANADEKEVIQKIVSGESIGTIFWPQGKMEHKKRWIAFSSTVQGKIIIDKGASQALLFKGKSLLPSGILGVDGVFEIGNTVSVVESNDREIARGIVNYSSQDIVKIKGCQSEEIKNVLGYQDYDEVIHRNNMVSNV